MLQVGWRSETAAKTQARADPKTTYGKIRSVRRGQKAKAESRSGASLLPLPFWWLRSGSRGGRAIGLDGLFDFAGDLRKCSRFVDGQVGEDLAVEVDIGEFQPMHELA